MKFGITANKGNLPISVIGNRPVLRKSQTRKRLLIGVVIAVFLLLSGLSWYKVDWVRSFVTT